MEMVTIPTRGKKGINALRNALMGPDRDKMPRTEETEQSRTEETGKL